MGFVLTAEQLPDDVSFAQKDGLYAEKTDSGQVTHFAFYRDGDAVGWTLDLSEDGLLARKLETVRLPEPHDPEDELTEDEVLGWVHRIAGYQGERMICSFCEKTNLEVEKLIAGPECYICNECVDLCSEILSAD